MLDFSDLFLLHVTITYFKPQLLFFTQTSKALLFCTEGQAAPGTPVFVKPQLTPVAQITAVYSKLL